MNRAIDQCVEDSAVDRLAGEEGEGGEEVVRGVRRSI